MRFIAADIHPDHDTIAAFRRENAVAFAAAFARVLSMAQELKLLSVGMVSIDGTKIDANASKIKSVRYDRAKALRAQLDGDIAALMARAEAADRENPPIPRRCPMISPDARRFGQTGRDLRRLEAEAKARAEAERPAFEAKQRAHDARNRRGRGPNRPTIRRRRRADQSDRPGQQIDAQVQTP